MTQTLNEFFVIVYFMSVICFSVSEVTTAIASLRDFRNKNRLHNIRAGSGLGCEGLDEGRWKKAKFILKSKE